MRQQKQALAAPRSSTRHRTCSRWVLQAGDGPFGGGPALQVSKCVGGTRILQVSFEPRISADQQVVLTVMAVNATTMQY